MPKMSTDPQAGTRADPTRFALSGPTMGTRWSVLFHGAADTETAPIEAALAAAVAQVDGQMSPWKPDSALMRVNRAPVGAWIEVPAAFAEVLAAGLEIGRRSDGAFDVGMGDAVNAWGFGPQPADAGKVKAVLGRGRAPAHELVELDRQALRLRKRGPVVLDFNGIAKGYGADRLMAVLERFGIRAGLVAIDGELKARGLRPDGSPWTVAVERPDYARRAPHSMLALQDAAVATSGDYRHWVQLGQRRLSHTMDPRRGGPVDGAPASVTVVAASCMAADAWATALMVRGAEAGMALAARQGLNALFLERAGAGLRPRAVGPLFAGPAGR
ncbi:FAD:protein FMN transferase [Acidimangrovimonas pyrenivorans]|uniref:FAD:protein FMN transferase n=1 Tax=Acidimangrovimonas pyrenivorans TaxID=2030798 RepID=A0ABV7ADB0_9RHOB